MFLYKYINILNTAVCMSEPARVWALKSNNVKITLSHYHIESRGTGFFVR